jgi:hypothetical protein
MLEPIIHYNTGCICCKTVEEKMIKVGPMVFCYLCFERQFKTNDPINKERATYSVWLNRYKEKQIR